MPELSRPRMPKANVPSFSQLSDGAKALLFIAALVLSSFFGAWLQSRSDQIATADLSTQKKIVTSQGELISQIAKSVGPSVVSINTSITAEDNSIDRIFGFTSPREAQAAGTGVIISKNGLILTNRHVVPAGTSSVSVTLSDGTELKDVTVVDRTTDTDTLDVAFLKINDAKGKDLKPAVLGDSSKVQVGDAVVAIGNALGQFQNTVTSGIISGYGRSVYARDGSSSEAENLDNLFQTDAAINQGNSGGPLVNLNGQVIGINTAIASGSENIGFAIPINDVRGLVEQVVKSGSFSRPYLGVRHVSLSADVASQFDIKTESGAFVVPADDGNSPSVVPGSPADKAGLQERDVITAVDGQKVDATHSLISRLGQHQPGDKVKLTVVRGDRTLHIEATLGKMPETQ